METKVLFLFESDVLCQHYFTIYGSFSTFIYKMAS